MSLRYRLPLTYGLIALLAALLLGAALLLILDGFYSRQETRYLEQNAEVISGMFGGLPRAEIVSFEDELSTLAFLIQAHIRIVDVNDQLVLDSRIPTVNQTAITVSLAVEAGGVSQAFRQTINGDQVGKSETAIEIGEQGNSLRLLSSIAGNSANVAAQSGIVTPLNFGLGVSTTERSNRVVRQAIPGVLRPYNGYVELYEGPAFGSAILHSVARGLLVAGVIAVSLATLVGVWIGRRLAQPLLSLTATTQAMASGDLSVRSDVKQGDEIGQLAQTFNQMAQRVDTMVEALRRFVADAAHEIQTPMTALRTNLDLAEQRPEETSYIEQAQAQTQRLQSLTDSLLQLSRLDSEELSAESTPINLNQLLTKRSEIYAAQAEQQRRGYTLTLPIMPLCVVGNREQLQRMIDNLLDNGLKFSIEGGAVGVVLSAENQQAILTISNNSIGIDGDIERIFDRFHRAPNAAAYAGNGLGLAIVQRIIAVHNGCISVTNHDDQTIFTIKLPLSNSR